MNPFFSQLIPSSFPIAKKIIELGEDLSICWYPSAGTDFRDLLYLSRANKLRHASLSTIPNPNLFIHTDYFPWSHSTFLDHHIIHDDRRSKIMIQSIQELFRPNIPLFPELVDFPAGSQATGRAIYLRVHVSSHILGEWENDVLYLFVENTSFLLHCLLQKQMKIDTVLNIRHGGGLGGGKSHGLWIKDFLSALQTSLFICDGNRHKKDTDFILSHVPQLSPYKKEIDLNTFYTQKSASWSDYGTVEWMKPIL